MIIVTATVKWALTAARQAAEGGTDIPWWIWLILITVLLLLLLIGLVLQSKPGEPIPRPEERAMAPTAVDQATAEEDEHESPAGSDEASGEE